jgi:DNA modification methylase
VASRSSKAESSAGKGKIAVRGAAGPDLPEINLVYLPIEDIKSAPGNPRAHPENQIELLAKSISTFGFRSPALVDRNKELIAGHARVLAAKRNGFKHIPAIVIDSLTPAQCRALRIADNRISELGRWNLELLASEVKILSEGDLNFDLDVIGFEIPEIDLLIQGSQAAPEPGADPADRLPNIDDEPSVSRLSDVWKLKRHLLCCGNALDTAPFAQMLQGRKAAMAFMDPPYNRPIKEVANFGKIRYRDFVSGSGEMDSGEFGNFLRQGFLRHAQNSANASIHFVCCDWRRLQEFLAAGNDVYSELVNLCVWTKNNGGMGGFYRSQHELVLVFKQGRGKHRNNIELGKFGRNRTNVWNYALPSSTGNGDEAKARTAHPTVKPVQMIADAILDCTARDDIVLDGFCGSGSAIIAAERVGRMCFGVELDPLYVDVAIRRWQSFTGEKACHVKTGRMFDELAKRKEPRRDK